MTLEKLIERRDGLINGHANLQHKIMQLKEALDAAHKDLFATGGAIAEADFWIKSMQEEQKEKVH